MYYYNKKKKYNIEGKLVFFRHFNELYYVESLLYHKSQSSLVLPYIWN